MSALNVSNNITTTNSDILIYTVPGGQTASFSVSVCNKTGSNVLVGVSLSAADSPTSADYLEYNYVVYPGDPLKVLGLVAGPGMNIFVRSDTSNINVVLYGFVESGS